jgi:predicted NBD/HSP70 family sugar kinase
MRSPTSKATLRQTRLHNTRLVLKTIFGHGAISRAEIARQTGLTRPTVSLAVKRLMERGLVAEIGQGASTGGKNPVLLSVVDDTHRIISLDLGADEFLGAVINLRGEILYRVRVPKPGTGRQAVQQVLNLIQALTARANSPLTGIGIGSPGLIDSEKGTILQAVNLAWEHLPLRALIAEHFECPIYIAKDSHLAAMAEYQARQGAGIRNLVVIKGGRGLGAGIIIQGQLFGGDRFGAGEIGHLPVHGGDRLCSCGQRGCLEQYASNQAILRDAQRLFEEPNQHHLHRLGDIPADLSFENLHAAGAFNRPEFVPLLENVGYYLGLGIAQLATMININRIVLAGQLAQLGPAFQSSVAASFEEHTLSHIAAEVVIELSALGKDVILRGAAAQVVSQEFNIL